MKATNVFERYELKYLMNRAQYAQIMETVRQYMELDEFGHSLICNLYYDTPEFTLARRSHDHPLYKEKLRVRSYGVAAPGGKVFVELKKKYKGVVYKRRISAREDRVEELLLGGGESQIGRELSYTVRQYPGIAPRVYLSYEREAYFMKDKSSDFRVTFDENILFRTEGLSLKQPPSGERIIGADMVLMELKCPGAMPLWMARALSRARVYKTSFSKYGTAYQRMIAGGQTDAAAI